MPGKVTAGTLGALGTAADTALGQLALNLALRLDNGAPDAALAALARELRETVDAALAAPGRPGDPPGPHRAPSSPAAARPMSTVVVLGLPDTTAQHLLRAVAQHARWCRSNGVALPPDLTRLLAELAPGGQRRPTLEPVALEPHHDAVLLLDYDGAAARLGVSSRTVRRLTAAGKLPVVGVGGCKRIRASDLADYVEGL